MRLFVKYRSVGDLPSLARAVGAGVDGIANVIPQIRLASIALPEGADVDAALAALRAHIAATGEGEYAGISQKVTGGATVAYHVASDDTRLDECWPQKRTSIFAAHRHGLGAGVRTIVVDDGHQGHADLMGLTGWDAWGGTDIFWRNNEAPAAHMDGCVGCVWARRGNALGLAGFAPAADFYVVATDDGEDDGTGWTWDLVDALAGLVVAADRGGKVISGSFGWAPLDAPTLAATEDAYSYVWDAGAILLICAQNGGTDLSTFTSSMAAAPCVCVGATTNTDAAASFSNWGARVDVAAPGENVLVTRQGGYAIRSGTSYSTPYTAGICALIWEKNSALTRDQVLAILYETVDPPRAAAAASFWAKFPNGKGIPNAHHAVVRALSTAAANAGVVFPFLGFDGYGTTTVSGGVATTTLNGPMTLYAGGYRNGAAVGRVRLRLGSSVIYDGPPARLSATASSSGTAQPLTIEAFDGVGGSVEETYTDITVASLTNVSVQAVHAITASDEAVATDQSFPVQRTPTAYSVPLADAAAASDAANVVHTIGGMLDAIPPMFGASFYGGPFELPDAPVFHLGDSAVATDAVQTSVTRRVTATDAAAGSSAVAVGRQTYVGATDAADLSDTESTSRQATIAAQDQAAASDSAAVTGTAGAVAAQDSAAATDAATTDHLAELDLRDQGVATDVASVQGGTLAEGTGEVTDAAAVSLGAVEARTDVGEATDAAQARAQIDLTGLADTATATDAAAWTSGSTVTLPPLRVALSAAEVGVVLSLDRRRARLSPAERAVRMR